MAQISLTINLKKAWWVGSFLWGSALILRLAGRDEFPDSLLRWVVAHGFKMELNE